MVTFLTMSYILFVNPQILGEAGMPARDVATVVGATLVTMPFTYSITTGVSFGIVSWVGIRLVSGRIREVHPVLAVLSLVLVAYYGWWAA